MKINLLYNVNVNIANISAEEDINTLTSPSTSICFVNTYIGINRNYIICTSH